MAPISSACWAEVVELDMANKKQFLFTVPLEYCHSGDVVQGGFVTAMLDAAYVSRAVRYI